MIPEDIVNRVKEAADACLLDVIQNYVSLTPPRSGAEYKGDCPICHNRNKFIYNSSKRIYKCFSCADFGGTSAVKFVMSLGFSFADAIHELGRITGIDTHVDDRPEQPSSEKKGSYCQRMLADSGLTDDDVLASVYKSDDHSSIFSAHTFRSGSVNERGEICKGDDAIIEYYDLDGFPVTYEHKDFKGRPDGSRCTYFRVRWQYPESHRDKEGKPFKYRSPYGSGTPIYIPQRIRSMYKDKTVIPRLFIQEGEKKAEKACKHGILSVAVSGIQNLGSKGSLPEDLVRIIRECHTREVVFLMDSDWNDLSRDKKLTDDIGKRPRCFFYAARNFKEYMRSLKNQDLYVEIYVGHVVRHSYDKGIDDLLAHTLKGRESDFLADFERAMNETSKAGKKGLYSEIYKITSLTDHQLESIWGLDSVASFVKMHLEELKQLPEFLFNRHKWCINDNDEPVLAQPFDDDEKFWDERVITDRSGHERTECTYLYVNAKNFLQNRGFGRYRLGDGTFNYIHVDQPFVSNIMATDARDYLVQFAEVNCSRNVLEMLYKGSVQYLGPDKLSMLNYIEPRFLDAARDCQFFYFRDGCWKVSRDSVEQVSYSSIFHNVWMDRKREIPANYLGSLIRFSLQDDRWTFALSQAGKQCHFLQFLINASNFTWRKELSEIDQSDINENNIHLLSKLCAIGYMAMDIKDPNVCRAVIAMDGKQSEVGESNGRTGKSLVGELMRRIIPTAYIGGKNYKMFDDQFIWNDVTEKTSLVFMDDVVQNFNFEMLFPCITGDWNVNYKGGRRITFPFSKSPKLYISTNHAVKGDGSSFADRQWIIAFSDFYNDSHKPSDDFGLLFFSEWDYEQWNLTWNLIANCIQLYMRYGVVQAPSERIELRRLRQEVTESFILWADEYYSDTARFDVPISRRELQDKYFESDPQQRKFVSPNEFKKRFKKYCQYRGYVYNPHMYDSASGLPFKHDQDGRPVIDDKRGGIEFFTVGHKPGSNGDDELSTEDRPF